MIGSELTVARQGDSFAVALLLGAAAIAVSVKSYLSAPYELEFDEAGSRYNIAPNLLRAIARQESNFRPLAVNSSNANGTRDIGLMQINEKTAAALDVDPKSLLDPKTSIETAARLINRLKQELGDKYSYSNVIASYNVGSPTVRRSGIVNPVYVGSVTFHHSMYDLARIFA